MVVYQFSCGCLPSPPSFLFLSGDLPVAAFRSSFYPLLFQGPESCGRLRASGLDRFELVETWDDTGDHRHVLRPGPIGRNRGSVIEPGNNDIV